MDLTNQQNHKGGTLPGAPGVPAKKHTGIDQLLLQSATYSKLHTALLGNDASLTAMGIPTRVALLQNGFKLVKLFSPEHGLSSGGEDGIFQADSIDPLTGLPVTSLYGSRMAPGKEDLTGIDLVIVDLPDVGCRFYTYLWTMTHVMEACASWHVPVLITDRPNPTGGNFNQVEGPMLDEINCSSFIGRWRIPVRHCCTMGELAQYFTATHIAGLKLSVIPVPGWLRRPVNMDEFTPTSPAIQKLVTAQLYPGMGLLEGINVNEGRGTNLPFEVCGAPWIDAEQLEAAYNALNLPGILAHPTGYFPAGGLYAGECCRGLQFFITDATSFRPVESGIALIGIILKIYPGNVTERLYQTVANPTGAAHLDKLLGIKDAFAQIKKGAVINTDVTNEWMAMAGQYLLYPRLPV